MANAYPTFRPTSDKYLNVQLLNISASPTSAWLCIPAQGIIVDGFMAISAAITVANAVITVKKGSTTLGTITAVQAGSAAGSLFQMVVTGTESARTVKQGDVIELASDGGSTTTAIGTFTIVTREL